MQYLFVNLLLSNPTAYYNCRFKNGFVFYAIVYNYYLFILFLQNCRFSYQVCYLRVYSVDDRWTDESAALEE